MTAQEPSDPNAPRRRTVLRWIAALPGIAAIGLQAGCSAEGGSGSESNGTEGGDPPDSATETGEDAPTETGEDVPTETGEDVPTETGEDVPTETGADASEPNDVGEPPVDADIPPEIPAPDPCEVTGSDVLGPFHEPGAPMSTVIAGPDEPGERIRIDGRVYGPDCDAPLAGALLDVWQADAEGGYHNANAGVYRLRGQMLTDDQGRYSFVSILPGNYELGPEQWRPAHIHFNVSRPGLTPLTTQLYFEGDPYLPPNDACGSCNSDDPTHIVPMVEETNEAGETVQAGWFDIVLGGSSYR